MLANLWEGLVSITYDASFSLLNEQDDGAPERLYQNRLSFEKEQFIQNSNLSLSELNDIIYILETFAVSFVDLTNCGPDEFCLTVYSEDVLQMDVPIERLYEKNQNKELRDYLVEKRDCLLRLINQRKA
jgi:hypothetical protein